MRLPVKGGKPKKRVRKVEYWDCGTDSHFHIKQGAALRCMEKHFRQRQRNNNHVNKKRYIDTTKEWANGAIYKDAGKIIGVSSTRCREIVRKIFNVSEQLNIKFNDGLCLNRIAVSRNEKLKYYKQNMKRISAVAKYWGI